MFYAPLIPWLAWLAVRHRSATVFTAANPSIVAGGVIGESKIAILDALCGDRVAPSERVPGRLSPGQRLSEFERFMTATGCGLPIVAKPDQGQRGTGVVVLRDREALVAAAQTIQQDVVIQPFIPGHEYGLFYVRRPSEPRGRLFSITDKRLPFVRGDGRRSLERLILDDSRTVGMARFHLARQRERLHWVPAEGERVGLGDCGSHCRGALFLNGWHLWTPALETAVDEVARRFTGFFFGRFDVRAASPDALKEGRFVVLELNGVSSEATHIYDPTTPLWRAYQVLGVQWRLAFEIGAENAARGERVWAIRSLVELWRGYRRFHHNQCEKPSPRIGARSETSKLTPARSARLHRA